MAYKTQKFIMMSISMLMVFVLSLLSCQTPLPPPNPPSTSPTDQLIVKTLTTTDWLSSLFLLAVPIGLFAGFNGVKTGFLGAGCAVCGLLVKGMLSQLWIYPLLTFLLIAVVCCASASIIMKSRVAKELVTGIEGLKAKAATQPVTTAEANTVLQSVQTPATQKLVDKIKSSL